MGPRTAYLLKERRFLPLFITQFFGAFNDNAFKLAMLTLISYHLSHTQAQSESYQAIAGALFTLPYFFLSATSGQLADKLDKSIMIRFIKGFEILLMILGAFALYYGNIFLMMIVLTGMGAHSTFFGPIKYAILPDHLPKKVLLGATGLIEASTFMAILLGTTMGTLAIGSNNGHAHYAIILTIFAAIAGFIACLFIPRAPSSIKNDLSIDWNIVRATYTMMKGVGRQPDLLLSIMTISWFWLIGAVVLTKMPDFAHYVLNADNVVFAFFLALFSIGIACGSLLINRFLSGRITLIYVPITMLILSVFTFDLYLASRYASVDHPMYTLSNFFHSWNHWRISFDLFMLAFSAGLFVVPLYTYLQVSSHIQQRARTIAVNNIYNALFIVLGTFLVMFLIYLELSIPQVFLVLSVLNALVALLLLKCLPKNCLS